MQIEMKGIDKSFGTNQVLKDAGFVLGTAKSMRSWVRTEPESLP